MSTDRDTKRVVRSWLQEGVTALPDRVLDAVLDQLPATRQRRASWLAWRLPTMNMYAKLGVLAAAIAVMAVVGYSYLWGGRGLGDTQPTPLPTPTPTVLTPSDVGQTLAPGTYRVEGTFAHPFTFTIESAWILEFNRGNVVSLNRADDPGADWLDILLIENVYADPCAGRLSGPPVPKTPDDLVQALSDMAGFEAGPITEAAIGAHIGSHVVVTNDMDGNVDGCVSGNSIPMFTISNYPDPAITNGGGRDEFWVVDVDGTPVIVHGSILDRTDEAADVLETGRFVETITFD